MYIFNDYVTPVELTGYGRAALADLEANQFRLAAFLPSNNIDDLDYRFTKGGEGLTEAATFRAYDAESPIGARPGMSRVSGQLPPISRKIVLGEYARLKQRQLPDAIKNLSYGDSERMVRSIAGRVELARGQALVTGKVTIAENGVIAEVDFGRASAHTNATITTKWGTSATATPIADLLGLIETFVATNNGQRPDAVLMPGAVRAAMLRTTEVRGFAAANGVTPSLVTPATLGTILSAFDIPPIVINDEQVNVNGVATRVIAAKQIVLVAREGLGATLWGTTAESLEPDYSGVGEGIVAGSYSTKDPVAVWTKAAAIVLPVVANPNLTLNAQALA